jgi:hypothetical protein
LVSLGPPNSRSRLLPTVSPALYCAIVSLHRIAEDVFLRVNSQLSGSLIRIPLGGLLQLAPALAVQPCKPLHQAGSRACFGLYYSSSRKTIDSASGTPGAQFQTLLAHIESFPQGHTELTVGVSSCPTLCHAQAAQLVP